LKWRVPPDFLQFGIVTRLKVQSPASERELRDAIKEITEPAQPIKRSAAHAGATVLELNFQGSLNRTGPRKEDTPDSNQFNAQAAGGDETSTASYFGT